MNDDYRPAELTIIGYKDSKIYEWYKSQAESENLHFEFVNAE